MKVVAKVNAAVYGGLVKILSVLAQGKESTDVISIKNGVLLDSTYASLVKVDFTNLLNKINLDFLNPANSVKLMKLLRGGSEYVFLENENNTYSITNMIGTVTIRKAVAPKNISYYELSDPKSQIILDSETVGLIAEAVKTLEAEYLVLELAADSLKPVKINIKDEYEYKLDPNYEGEVKKFKVLEFAPFKGSEYEFKVYQKDNEYILETVADMDIVEVQTAEKLQEFGEFDAFSFA